MLKDALQYIIGLQQPRIEENGGKKYFFTRDGQPSLLQGCRTCEPMQLSTLTGLVEYIREKLDADMYRKRMMIQVVSETEVRLVSQFNEDMKRWEVVDVKARVPEICLDRFLEQEKFIIQMQSMFLDTPDKALVMQVAGNVEDRTVASYGDDGVTQRATVRTGIANMEDVVVPNPVRLKPFRTFHEVGQPEIEFVFRMKNAERGISCALFEADGGMWKFHAVHEIAEYLKAELADVQDVVVLS